MKLRSLLEDLNYKQEALHFQRLMLENEWIEDLDIELEHFSDQDGDHFNAHVKHPEFFDLTFHVDEEFSISHETADEPYGRTAEKAYHTAMPILLGMTFGRAAVNKRKGAAVEDYELATDNGAPIVKLRGVSGAATKELGDGTIDLLFVWDIPKQGWKLRGDDEVHTTMSDLLKYVDDLVAR